MFYYLYEIRNNLNGKIYVGVHKTKDMNDGYMGSGKIIRSAIDKYGIENFTKVILETFDTSEAMFAREKEVVNDEFLLREDVYNLRRGGQGGFDYLNSIKTKEERSIMGKKCHVLHPALAAANFAKGQSSAARKKGAKTKKEKYGDNYFSLLGSAPKTEEHRNKISIALTGVPRTGSQARGHKKPKIECPHCDVVGAAHVMYRFHFDKCKKKPGGI